MTTTLIDRWLAGELFPGSSACTYHRGELARDRRTDPALEARATRVQELCDGEFAVISVCGHERGRIVGTKQVQAVTHRERGEVAYVAVRRG